LSGGAIYPHADGGVFLTVVSLRIAFTLRRASQPPGEGVPRLVEGWQAAVRAKSIESGRQSRIRKDPTAVKKPCHIVARAAREAAAIVEQSAEVTDSSWSPSST